MMSTDPTDAAVCIVRSRSIVVSIYGCTYDPLSHVPKVDEPTHQQQLGSASSRCIAALGVDSLTALKS
jgi:hypothetical protein